MSFVQVTSENFLLMVCLGRKQDLNINFKTFCRCFQNISFFTGKLLLTLFFLQTKVSTWSSEKRFHSIFFLCWQRPIFYRTNYFPEQSLCCLRCWIELVFSYILRGLYYNHYKSESSIQLSLSFGKLTSSDSFVSLFLKRVPDLILNHAGSRFAWWKKLQNF